MTAAEFIDSIFRSVEAELVSDDDLFEGIDDQRTVDRLRDLLASGDISRATLLAARDMRIANHFKSKRRDPSAIYFVAAQNSGLIKIGVACDPVSRLRDLQVGSPERLRLLAVTPGTAADERALHQRFSAHREHGEWFRPAPEVLALIESVH